jgi:predicted PurR-regulated permease PerM
MEFIVALLVLTVILLISWISNIVRNGDNHHADLHNATSKLQWELDQLKIQLSLEKDRSVRVIHELREEVKQLTVSINQNKRKK